MSIFDANGAETCADCGRRGMAERDRLLAENDKLRELVRDMNKAAHMLCEAWEGSCSKEAEGMSLHEVCPIGDTSELCVFGRLDERMHDLGIEVDG